MNMITTEPSTWNNFADHPSFLEFCFGDSWKDWYEGESPESDLALLQQCALDLLKRLPSMTVKLSVLDDLTTFVELSIGTVTGQFGIGCAPDTLYLQLDADSNSEDAAEIDRDNLRPIEIVDAVEEFVKNEKEPKRQ